jgi:hypothetical protein
MLRESSTPLWVHGRGLPERVNETLGRPELLADDTQVVGRLEVGYPVVEEPDAVRVTRAGAAKRSAPIASVPPPAVVRHRPRRPEGVTGVAAYLDSATVSVLM